MKIATTINITGILKKDVKFDKIAESINIRSRTLTTVLSIYTSGVSLKNNFTAQNNRFNYNATFEGTLRHDFESKLKSAKRNVPMEYIINDVCCDEIEKELMSMDSVKSFDFLIPIVHIKIFKDKEYPNE